MPNYVVVLAYSLTVGSTDAKSAPLLRLMLIS